MLSLAIVVVLYNSGDTLPALWECLRDQGFADWTLVMIDNASGDDAGPRLKKVGDARVSLHTNAVNEGFARAVNRGLRLAVAAGAERTMLLNPDVAFGPDFLRQLMDQWTATGAGVIAPRVMYQDDPDVSWYAGGSMDDGWIFSSRHDHHDPAGPGTRLVTFASGCCLGLTAATLRVVGLLDESFFVYWEDTDLCLRLNAQAVPIQYVSEPFLLHQGGASSGGERSPAATRLYYRSYATLLRKHFGLRRALLTVARVIAKERSRPGRPPGHGGRVAASLLRGLIAPLRPVPRL